MPKSKVKPEMRHGVGGLYGPGEIVELDERAAAAFSDKLELVEDGEKTPATALIDKMIEFGDELVEHSESEDQPMPTEELIDPRGYIITSVFRSDVVALLRTNEDLKTLGDIADATDDELLAIKGLGPKTLERIRVDQVLAFKGER